MYNRFASILPIAAALLYSAGAQAQISTRTALAPERPRDALAAQIRTQGFTCDKALGASRDAKRSKPDHAVWVLKCSNAVYRVRRYPDMAATVVPLHR